MRHLYPPSRLKELRNRALLSQRETARLTGLHRCTIIHAEAGSVCPRSPTLRRLLQCYDLAIRQAERRERDWTTPHPKGQEPGKLAPPVLAPVAPNPPA